MTSFWERSAHIVYHMFSFYFGIVSLVISHFSFEGGPLVLIASVPGHCLLFNFDIYRNGPSLLCHHSVLVYISYSVIML